MVQNKVNDLPKKDFITIKDLFYLCLSNWPWFIVSLALFSGIVAAYIVSTPPVYESSSSVLIRDKHNSISISTGLAQTLADIGLFSTGVDVNNELIILESPELMYEVVKRLHLNVTYHIDGRFYKEELYGLSLPFTVSLIDCPSEESDKFTIQVNADEELTLFDFEQNGKTVENTKIIKGQFADTISTPIGKLVVNKTSSYCKRSTNKLYVNHIPLSMATKICSSRLRIELNDEKASVIDLFYKDVCPQRAKDILNTLIIVYNESWMDDKNQMAVSTSIFINDRLDIIEKDLDNMDEVISVYKSENLLPDVEAASNLYMTQSSKTNLQILELNNQLYMAQYIKKYIIDNENEYQLIPTISDIGNHDIQSLIREYNDLLLERNRLLTSCDNNSPLVVDKNIELGERKQGIVMSIDNQIEAFESQIKNLEESEQKTISRIAANPTQARFLLSLERQQKVKESLYLFLLQKREENELSKTFTAYNTRIIKHPSNNIYIISLPKNRLFLLALILGIIIPVIVIFLKENGNTKVRGRRDLENLTLPFVGEIPLYAVKRKKKVSKKESEMIVVKEGKRDMINEAFRVVRTNLEFMSDKDKTSEVIAITSFNPHSGKSFIAINIAISFAIKGKKTLLVDSDMRHFSLSSYINYPKEGLSDYLGGSIDMIDDIIVRDEKYETLDILPIGTIPPNPTELLFSERLNKLIDELRERYDYILMDCPPVELVADTNIIGKLVDRTIFVVRAGILERSMLIELENMYNENKYKKMTVILNGTVCGDKHYSYRYSYHYGYGKNYHYACNKNENR